jgi:hypothetical protein
VNVTDAPVVALINVAGDHKYVTPPVAVIVIGVPTQVVKLTPALIGAEGVTVTVKGDDDVQPSEVPVTVYVVVVPFTKFTLDPVVALKYVAGDQVYVVAPEAVKAIVPPVQIDTLVVPTTGIGLTVTVEIAVFIQPAREVPVTVYGPDAAGTKAVPFVTPLSQE